MGDQSPTPHHPNPEPPLQSMDISGTNGQQNDPSTSSQQNPANETNGQQDSVESSNEQPINRAVSDGTKIGNYFNTSLTAIKIAEFVSVMVFYILIFSMTTRITSHNEDVYGYVSLTITAAFLVIASEGMAVVAHYFLRKNIYYFLKYIFSFFGIVVSVLHVVGYVLIQAWFLDDEYNSQYPSDGTVLLILVALTTIYRFCSFLLLIEWRSFLGVITETCGQTCASTRIEQPITADLGANVLFQSGEGIDNPALNSEHSPTIQFVSPPLPLRPVPSQHGPTIKFVLPPLPLRPAPLPPGMRFSGPLMSGESSLQGNAIASFSPESQRTYENLNITEDLSQFPFDDSMLLGDSRTMCALDSDNEYVDIDSILQPNDNQEQVSNSEGRKEARHNNWKKAATHKTKDAFKKRSSVNFHIRDTSPDEKFKVYFQFNPSTIASSSRSSLDPTYDSPRSEMITLPSRSNESSETPFIPRVNPQTNTCLFVQSTMQASPTSNLISGSLQIPPHRSPIRNVSIPNPVSPLGPGYSSILSKIDPCMANPGVQFSTQRTVPGSSSRRRHPSSAAGNPIPSPTSLTFQYPSSDFGPTAHLENPQRTSLARNEPLEPGHIICIDDLFGQYANILFELNEQPGGSAFQTDLQRSSENQPLEPGYVRVGELAPESNASNLMNPVIEQSGGSPLQYIFPTSTPPRLAASNNSQSPLSSPIRVFTDTSIVIPGEETAGTTIEDTTNNREEPWRKNLDYDNGAKSNRK